METQYQLPFNLLSNTEVIELWDFLDYPVLYLLKDTVGTFFLSYLSKYIDDRQEERHIISVSPHRLELLRSNKMSIKDAYDNPENSNVFILYISETTGETLKQFMLPVDVYKELNPISKEYKIYFEPPLV